MGRTLKKVIKYVNFIMFIAYDNSVNNCKEFNGWPIFLVLFDNEA